MKHSVLPLVLEGEWSFANIAQIEAPAGIAEGNGFVARATFAYAACDDNAKNVVISICGIEDCVGADCLWVGEDVDIADARGISNIDITIS